MQPSSPTKFVNEPVKVTKSVAGVTSAGLTVRSNLPLFVRVLARPVTNEPT